MAGRSLRRGFTLLVLLVAVPALSGMRLAHAQGGDDLATIRSQVIRLQGEGKYDEAIPLAERYVALAREKHGEEHPGFAVANSWLAGLYYAQGRYAEGRAPL